MRQRNGPSRRRKVEIYGTLELRVRRRSNRNGKSLRFG